MSQSTVVELGIRVCKTAEGALCKKCARKLLGESWVSNITALSDEEETSGEFGICYRCGKASAAFLF